MNPKQEDLEHDFSIELKSNKSLTRLSTSNEPIQEVLIEGTLGRHIRAVFHENTILEVQGEGGILRLNIRKDEIIYPEGSPEGSSKKA